MSMTERLRRCPSKEWQGAVDPVGGKQLASLLSKIQYGGSAAVSGLTGGERFLLRCIRLFFAGSACSESTQCTVRWMSEPLFGSACLPISSLISR